MSFHVHGVDRLSSGPRGGFIEAVTTDLACSAKANEVSKEREQKRPLRIGILGGIGSGKSTVARMLASRGAIVVDADRIGHDVLNSEIVKSRIVALLGDDVLNEKGCVERRRVAQKVFGRPDVLNRFNTIVHPPLLAEFHRRIEEATRKNPPAVVLDAALLLEWGLGDLCDVKVFVEAPEEVRVARAQADRGWSAEEFKSREAAQMALDIKRNAADFVIENGGSIKTLEQYVAEFWANVVEQSQR